MAVSPELSADLEWVRDDFRRLVAAAGPAEFRTASEGTRWTNRELLFHMWFGQRVAHVILPVMGAFNRLPPAASRGWASALSAVTGPYTWVNFAGSMAGGRVIDLGRVVRWMDADTAAMVRWADAATPEQLAAGMSVPQEWDPYFSSWMSRGDVLAWAPQHYRHHRRQLTLPV